MKKKFLFLVLTILFLAACSEPKKNMEELKNEAEKEKTDDAVHLLKTEKIDEAIEYCFKTSDSVKPFANDVFIQIKEGSNSFFRIEQGEMIECKAEEVVLKDTVLFNNPYNGQEEEIMLEVHGFVLEDGSFYMKENGNSGKFIKYKDGTQEWMEIAIRPAWTTDLVWLYVSLKEPEITETEYILLYNLKEKKVRDVFRDFWPEGFRSAKTIISPESKGVVLNDGQMGEQKKYYYINAISGERVFFNELVKKPLDTVVFQDERILLLTLEQEAGKTEKFRYDLLDKKLYGELEKITPERIEIEDSAAYIQLENDVYTLHVSEKSILLKELDPKKSYRFQASPSGNKIAITERAPIEGVIKQLGIFDIEKESYRIYPQKFSNGQQRELSWVGENCFLIEVWGGYYFFYEF